MRIGERVPPPGPATGARPWPPLLASRGIGAASAHHAHHGMHLVVALGEGALHWELGDRAGNDAGLLTAPDVPHRIDASGGEVLIVFLDPESRAGRALRQALAGQLVRPISAAERTALLEGAPTTERLMGGDGVAWTARAAGLLGAASPETSETAAAHPGVRKVLNHLQETGPDADTSLAALAAVARLSEGRLMHAFTASVGIPIRPYLAWLKLQRAAAAIVAGTTLTEAAHQAGFADSAHMTRSFQRMLGMRPRDLRARVTP